MSHLISQNNTNAVDVHCAHACTNSDGPVAYTIATLVTKPNQHRDMVASFLKGGFSETDCEFLFIDNTGNEQTCAYRGLNALLNAARGRNVILCHQDIHLLADDREKLDATLEDLEKQDPNWALAGNAGGVSAGQLALRVTDPHGADQHVGDLPTRAMSLDENFIVVKAAARLSFSNNLSGFHFYGADICLNANVLGWNAYVIDFHLAHLSGGKKDSSFFEMEDAFRDKWCTAFAPRWLQTTCSLLRITGDATGKLTGKLTVKPYEKISRMLSDSNVWKKNSQQTKAS